MQIIPLWQKFKQIGSLDKQVCDLELDLQAIETSMAFLRDQSVQHRAKLEEAQHQHKKKAHVVVLLEAEISEISKKIALKNKTLDDISHPKARLALEHEITGLEKECAAIEDRCLAVMTEVDTLTKFLTEANTTLIPTLASHEAEIVALLEKKEKVTHTIAEATLHQQEIVGSITPEWLAKYRDMKTHISDPIAPLVGQTCSACFYSVRPQDFLRLRNNAILPCQGCFRLLYCDSEQQQ